MSALPRLTAFFSHSQEVAYRFQRMGNIVAETGIIKLCTQGLGARCVMIGTLTAGQFGIFDVVMNAVRRPPSPSHVPFKLALLRLALPSSISTTPTTTTNLAIGDVPSHAAHRNEKTSRLAFVCARTTPPMRSSLHSRRRLSLIYVALRDNRLVEAAHHVMRRLLPLLSSHPLSPAHVLAECLLVYLLLCVRFKPQLTSLEPVSQGGAGEDRSSNVVGSDM